MEHPRPHPDASRVSVWRLDIHQRWVMQMPDAHEHAIEQWKFGSHAIKPTTMRALNLGPPAIVRRTLLDSELPWLPRPVTKLKGKDSAGRFLTAAAKEYPSGMCRALILSVIAGLRHRIDLYGTVEAQALDKLETSWIHDMYSHATQSTLSGTYLPDFQG